MGIKAGYGIRVQTDTGHFVWLTKDGTSAQKNKALPYDSKKGAEMDMNILAKNNPHAVFEVKKFSE